MARRDQLNPGVELNGSEFAERHIPRRTTKTRRPSKSETNPLQRPVAARRRTGVQQKLPYGQEDARVKRRALVRMIPEGFGPRLFKVSAALLFITLLFGGLIFALYVFGGSRFFALRTTDVEGNQRLTKAEIEKMVEEVAYEGVWRVKIKSVQERLLKNDLIESAEVTRVLPDKLHVVIKEREPFALARRGDKLVCVDRNGMMFGDESLLGGKNIPPTIKGLMDSGENMADYNHKILLMYQQLLKELDSAEPKLSPRIDEVIFDDDMDIRLVLKDSRIAVMLGQEDYRTRLNAALDVLDAVRRKDAESLQVLKIEDAQRLLGGSRIAYLNATIPKRVIVGLAE
jgi:cell division septal protein FtsQ